MEVDYFTYIPSEITTDILSRLSIRSLAISKSVCKSWRDLFDFVKSKIKTPPVLVRFHWENNPTRFKIIEIEDEDEDEADLQSHDLHYHPLTDLEIPYGSTGPMAGNSANALLLLYSLSMKGIYICNLITREYTELSYPDDYIPNQVLRLGFGVSKISEQYKVVWINADAGSDPHCVYTLGTGTWRRVEPGAASGVMFCGQPILCNDNLHWKVYDPRNSIWSLCGFDIETECFSIFSFPTPMGDGWWNLSVLRDCLCSSHYNEFQDEIVIWMMKEYQVDESWTIEYKMSTTSLDSSVGRNYISVEALKLFKDGDVLMLLDHSIAVYYSNNTRTLQQVNMLKEADPMKGYALIFNPSLLSLKSFGFENVISF
ncbi:F-box protein At3g07870-like [Salvia hispanica]|uniref:F-box protein At3g07870-like n=1 Tax=Salvia hispanica TaxID=49212 RepID=UPI002008F3B0|nr:F-box protein At3g07870-like [Salvia hispanica]